MTASSPQTCALIGNGNQATAAVSRQDLVSSTTEATSASKVLPLTHNSATGFPIALAAAASNETPSSLTHITPNINQLLPSKLRFCIWVMPTDSDP